MKRGIKHGHLPGDVPKHIKIALLEKGHHPDVERAPNAVKAYRKRVLSKERAVLKRRFQRSLLEEQ